MNKLAIIGASGHGKVIADAAEQSKKWKEIIFFDDNKKKIGQTILNFKIAGTSNDIEKYKETHAFIVGIGDNKIRSNIQEKLENEKYLIATIIHPKSIISKYTKIEKGTVVMAGVIINTDIRIGKGCIINTSSSIDHDCILEDYVHISPHASIAGLVRVGQRSWIGMNTSLIQKINIGENTVVGAGSVVIKDLPSSCVVVGNPAKIIKNNRK